MIKHLQNFLLITLIVIIFTNPVFSQNKELSLFESNNILGRCAKITMLNDVNPALSQKSNDTGYTLGINADFRFSIPQKNAFYKISLHSHLYTEYVHNRYINDEGRKIYPQYFTEISTLNFSYNKFFEKRELFFSLKSYLGIYNKKEAVPLMALYLQGGIDGKGGYHDFLDNNPGQDNISTGKILPLIFIEPGFKKYLIRKIITKQENAYLKIHTGVRLGYPFSGIKAFANINSELPLFQYKINNTNIFKLAFRCQHELSLHTDGVLYAPELGFEASILFLTIGYTSIFYFGEQNKSFINYVDEESLMRLYLKINF